MRNLILGLLFAAFAAVGVSAEGNLASLPTRLPDLALHEDLTMSQYSYDLETGKYYRWRITSDGGDKFAVMAPELFRNAWIDKIVIDEIEVKTPSVYSVVFEEEGVVDVWFVPLRPGRFDFWVDGYETRGMAGHFMVN